MYVLRHRAVRPQRHRAPSRIRTLPTAEFFSQPAREPLYGVRAMALAEVMPSDLQLGASVLEALRIAKQMRADGASEDATNAYLETALRAAWPSVRTWKYECETCSDTGWEIRTCREGARCGRPKRIGPATIAGLVNYTGLGTRCSLEPTYTHTYAVPCTCRKGFATKQRLDREFDEPVPEPPKKPKQGHFPR